MSERINIPFSNEHFVAFCEKMIGMPYWYGTVVYKCRVCGRSGCTRAFRLEPLHRDVFHRL